jgi:hypothetical protein
MSTPLPIYSGIKRQSGFALVIALSLMAFVLLLLLSITSFVAVEQQGSNIAKQQLSARQNALAGLQVAMGELQLRVGPDQRATASADILDADNNPYTLVWHSDPTKIWDSTASDWVTGGDSPDFALPLMSVDPSTLGSLIGSNGKFDEAKLGNDAVELMKVSNPSDGTLTALKAEKRPISDANGAVSGNYAWVAQDESLKANLAPEHAAYITIDKSGAVVDENHSMALAETSRRLSVFPYANPAGATIDGSTPFSGLDPQDPDQAAELQKSSGLADLLASGLLTPSSTNGKTTGEILAPYQNHFTLNSKGVLADSKNGGLRRDLSRGLDDQYFEKLHEVPVFGVDRDGTVTADGINEPVGDQWKFFRDYYNFYRPVDDGLVSDLSAKNIFYGLDDVTSPNPSTRMRITNEDGSSRINDLYQRYGTTPAYSGLITPTTLDNPYDSSLNQDSWFMFTPQLRPVVLKKTIKIGLQSRQTTSADFPDPADAGKIGKYVLQFKVYPSIVLWNPYNVTIDLDPSASDNPLAGGEVVKFDVDGNINIVFDINGDPDKTYQIGIGSIAPGLIALSPQNFSAMNQSSEMPPGQVWVLGLGDSYTSTLEPWGPGDLDPDGNPIWRHLNATTPVAGSTGQHTPNNNLPLFPASSGNNVKESNGIIYTNSYYPTGYRTTTDPNTGEVAVDTGTIKWEEVYFDATDNITIKESTYTNPNFPGHPYDQFNSYSWAGMVSDTIWNHLHKVFHMNENSDLIITEEEVPLGSVSQLVDGDLFPFYQVDFRGRTLSSEPGGSNGYGNPAFPSFANVNFLGTSPLPIRRQDTTGDVKALYIPERISLQTPMDALPARETSDGSGFFGGSFEDDGNSASRISLYDLPRHPIISICDFRNLALGWYEDAPPRPIGASWSNATLSDLSNPYIRSHEPNGHNAGGGNFSNGAGCDTSYFYNDTLFDRYFFSGIPSEERDNESNLRDQTFPYGQVFSQDSIDERKPLANTRLSYYGAPDLEDLRDPINDVADTADNGFEKAAAFLMIDGAFNVNSTSPAAWQAVLSGFRNQAVNGVNETYDSVKTYTGSGSPFVDNFVPSADDDNLFAGHRRLSDPEVESLSTSLTTEIRDRGVALSLGKFVNRDLNGTDDSQQMSRIDKAIKDVGLNSSQRITDSTDVEVDVSSRPDLEAAGESTAKIFAANLAQETGAGLPGYLKQQDILRPLAPIMTTRGDTFVIRVYGESVNAVTNEITGKAWCEAVVQRVPDYVDDSTDAWDIPTAGSLNEKFGRRFKIIQFRWLDRNDVSS